MNHRTSAPAASPPRRLLAAATAAVMALAGAAAVVVGPAAAPAAAQQLPFCPPDGEMPPIGNEPTFTDNNVAVYAGGNYVATGNAAESEGLLLVRGDATFDRQPPGLFNVGIVGVGSGIAPAPGEVQLAVGGDLVITPGNRVEVGHGLPGGGAVNVGGTITADGGQPETNDGLVQQGIGQAAAMAPHADFQDVVVDASASLGAQTATGTSVAAGNRVDFDGDAASSLQVFEISAADLNGVSEFYFTDIPDGAAILVNVTGPGPLSVSATWVSINGVRADDLTNPNFGNFASQILFNVTDATSLTIGGSGQFMGSILAPAADTSITSSTNGRVYVGGNLTTQGAGNEQHNYPWIGPGPFGCIEAGSFTVAKALTGDGASAVPGETAFTVTWSADVPDEAEYDGPTSGELTVLADGTVVDGPAGLPAGTVVTLAEGDLPEVPGVEWGEAVFSVDGEPLEAPVTITIGEGTTIAVLLTNTANAVQAEVGGFSLQKVVEGDAADLVPPSTVFTVEYSYELDGEPVTGTLTLLADGTVVDGPQDLPVGTVVSFTEIDLPDVDGVVWGEPVFDPATVTVGAGENTLVTLTNTADGIVVNEVGGFSVQKVVEGTGADLVPPGTAFTVEYSYLLGQTTVTGTLTVLADGTVVDGPQNLPVGTVVSFTEIDLPDVDGVAWGEPVFDPATVTIGADENTLVTLTNTAEAPGPQELGGFSVQKVVEGEAADLVPADTAFTVEYSYLLGETPVSGTLTVLADGTVVDGPQNLPVGTEVSFTEISLPDVDGVVWGEPVFDPATVTIGADENTLVTLTNTADAVVVDEVGGFSVLKEVVGDGASLVPADTEFTLWFGYELGDQIVVGELTLLADGTLVQGPQNLPEGTEVVFVEVDLPDLPGIVWGEPVLSVDGEAGDTLVVGAGENTEITLTNTADVVTSQVGGISVVKLLVGDAASTVPAGTEFTVRYSYEVDGETVTASLTVLADGTPVDGPQHVPAGTVVTLEEIDLPRIEGVTWGTPAFSVGGRPLADGAVTAVAGETLQVSLTNTATKPGGGLAVTGGDVALLAIAAGVLVAGGAGAVALVRRHRKA